MKLQLSKSGAQNTITGYGKGYVMVNSVRYEHSLVVVPDRPIERWNVSGPASLREDDLAVLASLGAEIVLLGTGDHLHLPPQHLLQPLARARIGVEVMDTHAACRTFNILVAEGRKVAAALVL